MFLALQRVTVGCSRLKHSLFRRRAIHSNLGFFKSFAHEALHNLLERCSSMRELKAIHAQIIFRGLADEILLHGKLISFCAVDDAGDLAYARYLFDKMREPNRFMYNSLIRGYSNSDDPLEAVLLYRQMTGSGISPNEFTLPFVLKACAGESLYWVSVLVHSQAVKLGFGFQVCVQNALITVYVSCGLVGDARKLFDELADRTLVSWNLMIGGYSKIGCSMEAFRLFEEMRKLGLQIDEFTLANLIIVSSQTGQLDLGKYVHLYIEVTSVKVDIIVSNSLVDMYAKCGDLRSAEAVFSKIPNKDVVSWTTMVNAYANHGSLALAQQCFDQMPKKNVVSWNSLISSYIQSGRSKEALNLFRRMCDSRVAPDETTLIAVLSACSHIGDAATGEEIYIHISKSGVRPSVTLYNALMTMFGKCGAVQIAVDIFKKMKPRNLVSWNVAIGALALHGCGVEAIKLFEDMEASRIFPNEITFTGLLSACSHSGLIEMGRYYFRRMSSTYGISPEIEHYACLIDLLGRGGLLEEAHGLIRKMPMRPDIVIWGALLAACRTHHYWEMGKFILKQLLELLPHSSGLCVLLSNLYAEARRWDDARKVRKIMNESGIAKCRAVSFIEIDGNVYEFMVDDKRGEMSISLYLVLDQLTDHLKFEGCPCNLSGAFWEAEDVQ
ncbi:pentatricopeptide repeat-containing protein At2g22410, mitochondrial-like [Rhodamnia argentea]|uniref:Pentatricopeptide repeat-containing protein At2g22410, mitochondrial-like n=1 Tax=Rhodamnia argentea TaxID=178133 RepID=A0A8B8P3Y7_9MYRT|nr:pentatricopeptide repeat-containing protein At2g22410, mitochondrial-like [Rhodamnia argentea]